MQETHKLGKIEYNTRFDSEEIAYAFQPKVSGFIREDIAGIINDVCNQLDDPQKVICIDKLEFNLGNFYYTNSNEEIKTHFRRELYNALRSKIAELSTTPSEKEKIIRKEKSEYINLIHFLQKGRLTWNSGNENARALETVLEATLENTAANFIKWLKQYGHHKHIRKRIIYQFKDPHIVHIIEKADPVNAPFITQYAGELKQTQKKEHVVSTSESEFRNLTWEVILAYILSDRGSRFNRKSFVKYTMEQIAIRCNISYGKLLSVFSKSVPKLIKNQAFKSEFPEIIIELNNEYKAPENRRGQEQITKARQKQQWFNKLQSLLQAKSKSISTEILQNLAHTSPAEFIKQLRHYILETGTGENIPAYFSPEQIKLITQILEPSQKDFIFQFSEYLESHIIKQELKPSRTHFRKTKWEAILVYLLEKHGSNFNRKAFIKNTIQEISARCGYSYKEVMMVLYYNIGKMQHQKEGSQQVKNILKELQDEAIVEYQKRILPDDEILQILYAHELFDEITFYVQNGYTAKHHLTKTVASKASTLLSELETISPELAFKYLGYLQKEEHLQQLLHHSTHEFVEETALLYMKKYYAASDDTLRKFRKAITGHNRPLPDKEYYTWLFVKLIRQRGSKAETILKEVNEQGIQQNIKTLQFPVSLFTLRAFLNQFLKEGKTELGFGLSYAETWKYIIEHHTAQLGSVVKQLMHQPGMFKTFLKISGNKLRLSILAPFMPSAYAKNFLQCVSESFIPENQSLPDKLKTELWQMLFETTIESGTKNESEIADKLLTRFMHTIKDKTYRKNSLMTLKKNAGAFSFMEKNKTLDIIKGIEEQILKSETKERVSPTNTLLIHEEALAFLKGEKTETISPVRLVEYLSRYFKEKPEQASSILITLLHSKKARAWWASKLPEHIQLKIIHLIAPHEFTFIHSSSQIIWKSCMAATAWNNPGISANKWYYMFEALDTCSRSSKPSGFRHELFVQILKDIPQYHKKEFLNELYLELGKKNPLSEKEIYLDTMVEIENMSGKLIAGEETTTTEKPVEKKQPHKHTDKPKEIEVDISEGTYISNAGLVLATPCLSPLFNAFGLLEDNLFKNTEAQERAVHLLQYLVDKSTSTPEFILPLNKIMCGVALDSPVPLEIEISDKEKNMIEQVIKDMIQHWKALGNTTVEGFRQSFLQREGILRFRDDLWELQVEEKAFDVLIDQIPWSFATIKYKWMDLPLYVKWR